jgi:hypothetical protein
MKIVSVGALRDELGSIRPPQSVELDAMLRSAAPHEPNASSSEGGPSKPSSGRGDARELKAHIPPISPEIPAAKMQAAAAGGQPRQASDRYPLPSVSASKVTGEMQPGQAHTIKPKPSPGARYVLKTEHSKQDSTHQPQPHAGTPKTAAAPAANAQAPSTGSRQPPPPVPAVGHSQGEGSEAHAPPPASAVGHSQAEDSEAHAPPPASAVGHSQTEDSEAHAPPPASAVGHSQAEDSEAHAPPPAPAAHHSQEAEESEASRDRPEEASAEAPLALHPPASVPSVRAQHIASTSASGTPLSRTTARSQQSSDPPAVPRSRKNKPEAGVAEPVHAQQDNPVLWPKPMKTDPSKLRQMGTDMKKMGRVMDDALQVLSILPWMQVTESLLRRVQEESAVAGLAPLLTGMLPSCMVLADKIRSGDRDEKALVDYAFQHSDKVMHRPFVQVGCLPCSKATTATRVLTCLFLQRNAS